jgi:predicted aspartyl protease
MPTLLLLLTILTAPAVPQSLLVVADARPRHLADVMPVMPLGATECRLRMNVAGLPLVRVEVVPGHQAWFVLDTGATGTTLHAGLVQRLGLVVGGHVRLATVDGTMSAPTVQLDEFRIAGVPVAHEVAAAVHALALVRQTVPDAEGILGQDVLARYDYMVDQVRQRLIIGRFAPPPRGVRVPLLWSAGRPVLQMGAGPAGARLVLDTGADVLVMEATAARLALGDAPPAGRSRALLQTHAGARAVDVEHHVGLRMANVDLPPVAVVRLPSDAWHMAPEVGLLPASLFGRVYVSARTGQAAVWPR